MNIKIRIRFDSMCFKVCRFIAKKVGMAGLSSLDQAHADMVVDFCLDFQESTFLRIFSFINFCLIFDAEMTACFGAKTADAKRIAGEKLFDGGMQDFNRKSAALLRKRGGKYFAGNKLSWADIAAAHSLNCLMDETRFSDIPHQEKRFEADFKVDKRLNELRMRVNEFPPIKKWIQNRPKGAANV